MKKQCSICKTCKNLNTFSRRASSKDGRKSACKECDKLKRMSLTGKIRIIYNGQCKSSKCRNHPIPNYTKQELIDWCLSQPLYHKLHKVWIKSEYNKWLAPSCDRIDDAKPYTLDNLQLTTWKENFDSGYKNIKNGAIRTVTMREVEQLNKENNTVVAKFHSMTEAARVIECSQGNIYDCCTGKGKTIGGFKWRYAK